MFEIQNQNFRVDFNVNNGGNNAVFADNYLHVVGLVDGLPHYLKYSFIHRIGALHLEGYQPLFVVNEFRTVNIME